jgi:RNA polymerase sigma-70 factor (ECF subfamily)
MSERAAFEEVLAAARDGEERALAALWRSHQPLLLRFLRLRHTASDVDDVASEVWLRVARSLGRFSGGEVQFRAWFFALARAASVDWYRRSKCDREHLDADAGIGETDAGGDPEQLAIEADATGSALAWLAQLPADQAEVIALRVVAGLETDRVAVIVGKRPGTVRVLQHRGLRRLAELLAAERADVTP